MPPRREMIVGLLAVAVWAIAPQGSAQAQHAPEHGAHGVSTQVSFLARMMIDVTVHQLTIEDDFLIRMPTEGDAADRPRRPGLNVDISPSPESVVALLGSGLDVSSDMEDDDIRLQVKPNLGRRGGLLRCTFRF